MIELIANRLGVDQELIKIVVVLLIGSLLGPLLRTMPTRNSRNIFSMCVGILLLILLLQEWTSFVMLACLLPYVLMQALPRRKCVISFAISSGLLLFIHLHRYMLDYLSWKIDCSVPVMIMTTKITYYAIASNEPHTMLDYLGYCLYFPGIAIGPTFGFQTYIDYVSRKKQYQSQPWSIKQCLLPVLVALAVLIPTALCLPHFPADWVLHNTTYHTSSLLVKVAILLPVGIVYRLKYYFAFYLVQTGVNLTGISWTTGCDYTGVLSGDIRFDIEPNPKKRTEYWNCSIQQWLKLVFYEPIMKATGSSTIALIGTFMISAFWHGIYLTYYLGFLMWGILIHVSKWAYKWSLLLPNKISDSFIFSLLAYGSATSLLNYIGMTIVLLQWNSSLTFQSDIYFWGASTLVILTILTVIAKPPSKTRKSQRQQSAKDS